MSKTKNQKTIDKLRRKFGNVVGALSGNNVKLISQIAATASRRGSFELRKRRGKW
jgi:hypothetical protein